jgi:phosphoglycolate phosphatase
MKTLILDFDGTVADTNISIVRSFQATFQSMNYPIVEDNEISQMIGLPLDCMFAKLGHIDDKETMAQAISIYGENYPKISRDTVVLFPHVKSTLQKMMDSGIILAIATNKSMKHLNGILVKHDIKQYFTSIVCAEDVVNKKPAPDMLYKIMEETKTSPEETLMVGDTTFDIIMGQRAGCNTCAVTYGNHSYEQLQSVNPTHIVDDFGAIQMEW